MRTLALIPARGGSKGIPNKNIYPLNGKPLICYTLDCIKLCNTSFDVVVSTDYEEIAAIVKQYSDVAIIKRPDDISLDTSTTESALLHALDELESKAPYDCVMTLQPTSPFRKPETIDSFLSAFEKSIAQGYDAQLTLTPDYSDFWICENGSYQRLFPEAPRRRQERQPLYIENSAIYITTAVALRKTGSVLGTKCAGFIIEQEEALDINTLDDMLLAELMLKRGM